MFIYLFIYLFICVCQVGGIKQKVLAAHRAGLQRVILPARNEKDLHEIPANIKVSSLSVLCVCVCMCMCVLSVCMCGELSPIWCA
jgi:ATP-dependent Lon protease